jgi:hypothetical protein
MIIICLSRAAIFANVKSAIALFNDDDDTKRDNFVVYGLNSFSLSFFFIYFTLSFHIQIRKQIAMQ